MHDYQREAIIMHRQTTNNALYWTNRHVCEWLKNIGLEVLCSVAYTYTVLYSIFVLYTTVYYTI